MFNRLGVMAMKMYIQMIAVLILASFAAVSKADESKWTKLEVGEEVTYQMLHLMDLGQTLDIKHHKNIKEGTMGESFGCATFIGDHPDDKSVIAFMVLEGVLHYAVTDIMIEKGAPKWVVHSWQLITIGAQGNVVKNNFSLGLKVKF